MMTDSKNPTPYTEQQIYDMLTSGAMRSEIPATDDEIDDAIELIESGMSLDDWREYMFGVQH